MSTRMREIAVYGRTGPMGVSEQAFYIPHLRTKLPDGSRQLQREEEKDKDYDQMRRSDQEIMMDFDGFNEADESQSFEKEMANFKSTADRRMLQTVYDLSPDQTSEVGEIAETLKAEMMEEMVQLESKKSSEESRDIKVQSSKDEQKMNDNEKEEDKFSVDLKKSTEIIGSIAKPSLNGDSSNLPKKKNKVKPENNPILQNWKERSTMAAKVQEDYSSKNILPPFPSDEHFSGIWRMITSPGGPMMDEEDLMEAINGDPNSSENLILRIDGTTAGGPILDVENQHRAAGGTWKFFQAEWCGESDEEDKAERPLQTRLRVRLLIPPTKDKVLVMEGEVKRGGINSAESISRENAKELLSSSSFGINNVGAAIDRGTSTRKEDDEFMYISGEAWVEERSGGDRRRNKLGRFSLMKRKDRSPDQYSYSIPAPIRYQD